MIFLKKNVNLLQIFLVFLIVGEIVMLVFVEVKMDLFSKILNSIRNNRVVKSITYCDYAKKTLAWIDTNRDSDGKYLASVWCDEKAKTCTDKKTDEMTGNDPIAMIWTRYLYIQKTNNKKEIIKLKNDIDYYYEQSVETKIQNDFWNCRQLLKITDSKILNKTYLDKVAKLCTNSVYLDTEEVVDGKVLTPVDYFNWQNIDFNKRETLKKDSKINLNYTSYVTYPSDFVARYKKNNNQNDLEVANAYFNKLLTGYYLNKFDFLSSDSCLLAISSLDLYSVNKEAKYLDWAKQIYNSYFIEQGFTIKAANPECALLNREMEKYDSNPRYKTTETKLLDFFIGRDWDGKGSLKNVTGEGGFFLIKEGSFMTKNLRQNALMVNLLCQ